MRTHRESHVERVEHPVEEVGQEVSAESGASSGEKQQDPRLDKKRDRRRNNRRRRGRDGVLGEEQEGGDVSAEKGEFSDSRKGSEREGSPMAQQVMTTSALTSMLSPPPKLISETIADYKDKFKEAFYTKSDLEKNEIVEEPTSQVPEITLNPPEYGTFELSEEEEEEIYLQRKRQAQKHEQNDSHSHLSDSSMTEHSSNLDTPPQH